MTHFNNLIFNMGCFAGTLIIGNSFGCPYQSVTNSHFASAIALTMIAGKALYQSTAKFGFAIHEYAISWYEYIVKNSHNLLTTKVNIANVDISAFQFAGVTGLATINIDHARGIQWNGKSLSLIHIF